MTVSGISRLLRARTLTDGEAERAVESCMVCDVLSMALAGGRRNMAWITLKLLLGARHVVQEESAFFVLGVEGGVANAVVLPPALLGLDVGFNGDLGVELCGNVIGIGHNAFSKYGAGKYHCKNESEDNVRNLLHDVFSFLSFVGVQHYYTSNFAKFK